MNSFEFNQFNNYLYDKIIDQFFIFEYKKKLLKKKEFFLYDLQYNLLLKAIINNKNEIEIMKNNSMVICIVKKININYENLPNNISKLKTYAIMIQNYNSIGYINYYKNKNENQNEIRMVIPYNYYNSINKNLSIRYSDNDKYDYFLNHEQINDTTISKTFFSYPIKYDKKNIPNINYIFLKKYFKSKKNNKLETIDNNIILEFLKKDKNKTFSVYVNSELSIIQIFAYLITILLQN
jgi:hypothetical protein